MEGHGHKVMVLVTLTLCMQRSHTLLVLPPVLTEVPPDEMLFRLQDDVTMTCRATGSPTPSYTWTRDSETLATTGEHYTVGDGQLTIHAASQADNGHYSCTATNIGGTDKSSPIKITMAFQDQLPTMDDETLQLGAGVSISLAASCPPSAPPTAVFWQRDGDALPVQHGVIVDLEGGLHIPAFRAALAGEYVHSCRNHVLRTMVTSHSVTLALKPHTDVHHTGVELLYRSPSQISLTVGDTLEIDCIIGASPSPVVTWEKVGDQLPMGRYDVTNTDTRLVIVAVTPEDSGVYRCVAFNDLTQHPLETSYNIQVGAAPIFELLPESVNVTAGDTIGVACSASGIPTPTIDWFQNTQHITKDTALLARRSHDLAPDVVMGELDVAAIQSPSVITCTASNTHGTVTTSLYIGLDVQPQQTASGSPRLHISSRLFTLTQQLLFIVLSSYCISSSELI